jgi:HAD superfamily phosphatase (TIGR01668 family)
MLSLLRPHLQVNSVLDLQVHHLRALRLDGLLLDIDRTLKAYRAADIGPRICDWLHTLRTAGFQLCLLSNGRITRIEPLARKLRIPFVARAFKPLPYGCRIALRQLGLRPSQAALIGDQLFADVLAGRLAGLFTVLVKPLGDHEPWFTRLKRPFERQLLRWMKNDDQGCSASAVHAPVSCKPSACQHAPKGAH